ncbi:hypothetical protein HanRHA438_Chr08g0335881 [Helianthus annuus]|nr:hypothetical protein HanRHA438_Chr08g0335881 [Helianthus annuus]
MIMVFRSYCDGGRDDINHRLRLGSIFFQRLKKVFERPFDTYYFFVNILLYIQRCTRI